MTPELAEGIAATLLEDLKVNHINRISSLFEIVEAVRYAEDGSDMPHLPIGTAQLLDTVELFLTRNLQDKLANDDPNKQIDWSASVKLAPLFESDVLGPDQLSKFASGLTTPFWDQFRRELLIIAASGMHFVPEV